MWLPGFLGFHLSRRLFTGLKMPEGEPVAASSGDAGDSSKKSKAKKSTTSNGLGTFARGKLVLARINLLDGTIQDFSIEVRPHPPGT